LENAKRGGDNFATTIFNVLEVCGVMSFGQNPSQLLSFYGSFSTVYNVTILMPIGADPNVPCSVDELVQACFGVVVRKVSFGDSVVIYTAESNPAVTTLITWNAKHFRGKSRLSVLTPEEYLSSQGISIVTP